MSLSSLRDVAQGQRYSSRRSAAEGEIQIQMKKFLDHAVVVFAYALVTVVVITPLVFVFLVKWLP